MPGNSLHRDKLEIWAYNTTTSFRIMHCQPMGLGHQNLLACEMFFMSNRRPGVAVGILRDWVLFVKGCCCPKWLLLVVNQRASRSLLTWIVYTRSNSEDFRQSFYKCFCRPQILLTWPGLSHLKENTKLSSKRVGEITTQEDIRGFGHCRAWPAKDLPDTSLASDKT